MLESHEFREAMDARTDVSMNISSRVVYLMIMSLAVVNSGKSLRRYSPYTLVRTTTPFLLSTILDVSKGSIYFQDAF